MFAMFKKCARVKTEEIDIRLQAGHSEKKLSQKVWKKWWGKNLERGLKFTICVYRSVTVNVLKKTENEKIERMFAGWSQWEKISQKCEKVMGKI